jgi:hypothetical protein
MAPRIITLDIETAPLDVYTWGIWEQDIALEAIHEDWTILSFTAKTLGTNEVVYADTGGRGAKKVRDDYALCKKLWSVLDSADLVITQNGRAFDIPKINTRLVMHGFQPYSPLRVIDTKIVASIFFAFTSNKLAFLTKALTKTKKRDHAKFPGFKLWIECLKDNPKAWAEMKKYNIVDVLSTEELYLKLRPWIAGHPNVGTFNDAGMVCPKCGSEKLQARGYMVTQTARYQRLHCQSCGGWSKARKAEKRASGGVTN